jgi:hypothetical protein
MNADFFSAEPGISLILLMLRPAQLQTGSPLPPADFQV